MRESTMSSASAHAYLKPKISILHVEDSISDAAVIRGMLDQIHTHEFSVTRVTSLADAISTVREHFFDTVLLDLNLEDSDGMETLETMRKACRTCPIVITTGNDSQLLAQNVIRKGAEDYLFKGHFNKDILNRTICYAIDRKNIDNENHEKSLILTAIMECSDVGYWDWHIQGNHKYYSPTLKSMLGYKDQEIGNSPSALQKLMHPDDYQYEVSSFKRHIESKGKVPYENESRYYHKDGSLLWVASRGKVIEWDQNWNPIRMVGCHIDISRLNKRRNNPGIR